MTWLASTSWQSGGTTYTLSLSAGQASSLCHDGANAAIPPTSSANIIGGTLTETAVATQTGVQTDYQVFNLPRVPSPGQAYHYNGGTVRLNNQGLAGNEWATQAVVVTTPAPQTLMVAVTECPAPQQN